MIIHSYDGESGAVISPRSFFGPRKQVCAFSIGTFSREIHKTVLETLPNEQIDELRAANRIRPLHLIRANGLNIAFYLSEIGSALSSTDLIEVNWKTGADHFILFGSAGSLDPKKTEGKYVIPTAAYRDEGMSYHYAPPSDYIDIKNAAFLASLFKELRLPVVSGRVWTTDALYRETRNQIRLRKEEGCIAVEMELAGLQAVCNFHGFELFHFLVTGDIVDQTEYTPDGLHEANHSMEKFHVALQIAAGLSHRV